MKLFNFLCRLSPSKYGLSCFRTVLACRIWRTHRLYSKWIWIICYCKKEAHINLFEVQMSSIPQAIRVFSYVKLVCVIFLLIHLYKKYVLIPKPNSTFLHQQFLSPLTKSVWKRVLERGCGHYKNAGVPPALSNHSYFTDCFKPLVMPIRNIKSFEIRK